MAATFRAAVISLAVALLAAGCSGDSKGAADDGSQAGTGVGNATVEGRVLDDQLAPVRDAVVFVAAKRALETRTDANGNFTLADVPPGTHQLVASFDGFKDAKKALRVNKGDRVEGLEFVMEPIDFTGDPHTETFIGEGFIACDSGHVFAELIGPAWQACRQDTNHDPVYEFQARVEGLFVIFLELSWEASAPGTSEELRHSLWKGPTCNAQDGCTAEHVVGEVSGPSPVRAAYGSLQRPITENNFRGASSVDLGAAVGPPFTKPFPEGDASKAYLSVQQPVTHYVTLFYNSEPEPGYTLVPE